MPRTFTDQLNLSQFSHSLKKLPVASVLESVSSMSTWSSKAEQSSVGSNSFRRTWSHSPYAQYSVLPYTMPSAAECFEESFLPDTTTAMVRPYRTITTPAALPSERTRVVGKPNVIHTTIPALPNAAEPPSTEPVLKKCVLKMLRKVHLQPVSFPSTPPKQNDPVFRYRLQHKCRTTVAWSPVPYSVGSVLMVDGDKGLDIGEVIELDQSFYKGAGHRGLPEAKAYRLVTAEEMSECLVLTNTIEQRTLEFLQQLTALARQGKLYNHPKHSAYAAELEVMHVTDCELQADHEKLYVYFNASRPITFCHLTRALYQLFSCRVWLHQSNIPEHSSANTSTESGRRRL